MKCCILEEPGRIRVAEVEDPVAGPGDVVIRVEAALTCGTDLKAYRRGHPKMPCPTPFGHEFAGGIVSTGAGVDKFRVGDAVMSANTGPCGRCFYCDRDQQNLCESIMDEMILGAYAEYLRIPARVVRANVYAKPDEIPYEQAALLEPLSSVCFGLSQIPQSVLRKDSTALIVGAGPIALLWLVALKASGVARVVVAGRREPRLEVARAMGADLTFGEGTDVRESLREFTAGRGADIVVECTGDAQVWQQAPDYARRGGSVIWFGGARPGTSVALDTYRMHYDGVTVLSPFHFRPRDVAAAHEILTRGDVDWAGFITSRATLDQVPAVFASLENGQDVKCAILPQAEANEVPKV
jgi:L-iditol 2-dehydrogenase